MNTYSPQSCRYSSQWRAENGRFSKSELQKMDRFSLLDAIRTKQTTYKEVDAALEEIKAFSILDWIGDKLSDDDLKGK